MRAVLFDFNGVLVEDEPLYLGALQEILAPRGIGLTRERYFASYLGYDDVRAFRQILLDHGRIASDAEIHEMVEDKARVYARRIEAGVRPFPGAIDFVRRCAERHALGVVSGAFRQEIDAILTTFGVRDRFAALVAAEDVRHGKPDPEGYLLALVRLRRAKIAVRPEDCVAIEDSPAGIAAARAAGMRVIGVAHSTSAADLRQADLVRGSIAELSLEDLPASTPDGLRPLTAPGPATEPGSAGP